MRTLPDPDPMLRFLDPDEVPTAVMALEPQYRGLLIRHFLVGRCIGFGDGVNWHLAATASEQELWDIVDQWTDDRLERAIADAAYRRAHGLPTPLVFEG